MVRADQSRAERWSRGILLAVLAIALLLALLVRFGGPDFSNALADRSFANASVALDLENPPTRWAPLWSTREVGALVGRGEGLDCSLPGWVQPMFAKHPPEGEPETAPIELQFRQACIAHDLCYRHGAATYGLTQEQCDATLAEDAFRVCRRVYREPGNVAWCRTQARKVLGGVVLGGATAFRGNAPPAHRGRGPFATDAAAASAETSSLAEYDPYPPAAARYGVPRLFEDACGNHKAALLFFSKRPGGTALTWRCYEGASAGAGFGLLQGFEAPVASQYRFRTGPPLISPVGEDEPARLLVWCRAYTDGNTTWGAFASYDPARGIAGYRASSLKRKKGDPATPSWFQSCPGQTDIGSNKRTEACSFGDANCDVQAVTLWPVIPVAGRLVRAVGLSLPEKSGRPCRLVALMMSGPPAFTELPLITDANGTKSTPQDCYRWFASPPLLEARGDGLHVTFFRRGKPDGGAYRTHLLGQTGLMQVGGLASWNDPLLKWSLPETAEPFVGLASKEAGLAPLAPKEAGVDLLSLHREAPTPSNGLRVAATLVAVFTVLVSLLAWFKSGPWLTALLLDYRCILYLVVLVVGPAD